MPMFLDAHAHFFSEAHLDAGTFEEGARLVAYSLKDHLDGVLDHAPQGDEVVVLNAALSSLPTSKHVTDSFDELVRLQTLYGARYARVRCVLGTCRADEPRAAHLLATHPCVVGARAFLKGLAPAEVAAHMATLAPVTKVLADRQAAAAAAAGSGAQPLVKYLEVLAQDLPTLAAAVAAAPPGVPLMIDHLGAWAAPPLPAYASLLAALSARKLSGSPVLLKGPGHRTSLSPPVAAYYASAAVEALGAGSVLLSASDAPHLGHVPGAFAALGLGGGGGGTSGRGRGCAAGGLAFAARTGDHLALLLPGLGGGCGSGGPAAQALLAHAHALGGLAPAPARRRRQGGEAAP